MKVEFEITKGKVFTYLGVGLLMFGLGATAGSCITRHNICNKCCQNKPSTTQEIQVPDWSNPSSGDLDRDMVTLDEPVIYLYGYDNEKVEVSVNLTGKLTCTYPKMESNKWTVTATKDGRLIKGSREYNYLFWEGTTDKPFDFSQGNCVEGSKTEKFLEQSLARLGLKNKEINDFMVYWLPKMQNNPYNVISFQTKAYTDIAKLNVSPAPKNKVRVFMAWYPSDTAVEIKAQKFENSVTRNDKETTVVEWGGTQVNKDTLISTSAFMDPNSDDFTNKLVDTLSGMSADKLQYIMNRVSLENTYKNGGVQPQTQGHEFTDKNGKKYTFTNEEWQFLQNTWAYTGKPDAMIYQFTIDELRAYLSLNMRK